MYTSFLAFNQISKESPLQAETWQQKLSIRYVNINHMSWFYYITISPNVKKLEHKQGGNKRQSESNRIVYCNTCNFHCPSIIDNAIIGIQIAMHDFMCVKVCHASSNVWSERKSEGPA